MSETCSRTILMTGAAGIVGSALRPVLRAQYGKLLLSDIRPITDLETNESFESCDVADLAKLTELARKADGIIHLAGMVGPDYSFTEVLNPNIVGSYNIFQAAREAGITNVVYASSHHVVGFVKRGQAIDDQTAHQPDSHYGLSKAFGESAGAYFAHKFGLNVLSIRIGYVGESVSDERRVHTWISPRDLAQLIEIGLTEPNLGYEVFYGTSENPSPFFDNANAFRFGYRPKDSSRDHVTDPALLLEKPNSNTVAGACVGGRFASVGYQGKQWPRET